MKTTLRDSLKTLAIPALVLAILLINQVSHSQAAAICDCENMQCEGFAKAVKTPVSLVGSIRVVKTVLANGKSYEPYILTLRKPLCVAGDNSDPSAPDVRTIGPVAQIQLSGEKLSTLFIRANLGRPVAVSATLFAATTIWHVTPALADVKSMRPTL